MRGLHIVMEYLRERQSPVTRYFHIVVLLLVLSQLVVSNFMDFSRNGEINTNIVEYYGTWIHIITGLFLFPVFLIFVVVVIRTHGVKYFFPYLFGDLAQLKTDIRQLKRFQMPASNASGIAPIVQGLGLGALMLTLLAGLIWFISWRFGAPWSDSVREVHEWLTGLVEAYVIGHGSMGALHILYTVRQRKRS